MNNQMPNKLQTIEIPNTKNISQADMPAMFIPSQIKLPTDILLKKLKDLPQASVIPEPVFEKIGGNLRDALNILNIPKIVCLCGSTRFYEAFKKANYEETMKGNIVLSVGFYPHASEAVHGETIGITAEEKEKLDELHKRKIDLADEILVLNINGYIGKSTKSEIEYAERHNKKIRYYKISE